MNFFVSNLFHDPFYFFSWVVIVAFSICFHEYAHASMAYRLGDDTAARMGHLSMNPMVQMGQTSIIMLLLIGIAWGATPVNVSRLRGRGAAAAVSFAGPAANLLLGLIFAAATAAASLFPEHSVDMARRFLYFGCVANGVLFVFNMLPVPMFDGWSVFSLFFPRMQWISAQQANLISAGVLIAVFITPVGQLIWSLGIWIGTLMVRGWANFLGLFF